MNKKPIFAALAFLALQAGMATAEEAAPTVYGSQLMTQQERIEYRNQMRALKTAEERETFRLEHHRKMQERAKAQGVTLPETPPAAGGGMGPGMGRGGGGMGPGGGGMGPGGGMGRGRN